MHELDQEKIFFKPCQDDLLHDFLDCHLALDLMVKKVKVEI